MNEDEDVILKVQLPRVVKTPEWDREQKKNINEEREKKDNK